MNRAVVCSASWLARLWGHGAVGERHAVGGAIWLGLIAVLVIDCVVFWLVALDLMMGKKENTMISLRRLMLLSISSFELNLIINSLIIFGINHLGHKITVIPL